MAKLTQEGYNALSAELEQLKTAGRLEAAEKIKEARSHGDLSENAEYDEAMNDQARLEDKIRKLEYELSNAEIIDEAEANDISVVRIGTTVTLKDITYDEEVTYKIRGKSDIMHGVISEDSPVGAALIGKAAGAVVDVTLPDGNVDKYEILNITK